MTHSSGIMVNTELENAFARARTQGSFKQKKKLFSHKKKILNIFIWIENVRWIRVDIDFNKDPGLFQSINL